MTPFTRVTDASTLDMFPEAKELFKKEEPKPAPKNPYAPPADVAKALAEYDALTRTRLSENFILRDFMYSTQAEVLRLPNLPEDPDMVIKAGKVLCEKVCEPVLARWGRFAITFGYQSRGLIEYGTSPNQNPRSSHPHQWDRGTFGEKVYARIDILPYCVEDGQVDRYEFGRWMMDNLDICLLMQWQKSNVYCITVGPKPRRVWLEWVPQGHGDNKSNKKEFMGTHYWQKVWPTLPHDKRPKHGPSHTAGKMWWGK